MKIEGNPKSQSPDSRRFSARKAMEDGGGKSFGEALKKAAAGLPGQIPASTGAEAAKPAPESRAKPAKSKAPEAGSAAETAAAQGAAGAEPARSEPVSFQDHMELIKLRLKSGYYSGKNIDEALSDRLTGYFDELA